MNDEEGLLRAICFNPDDDGLRLIYSDYLEGAGQVERAEFIRKSIEKASYGTRCTQERPPGIAGCGRCRFCKLEDELMWGNFYSLHQPVESISGHAATTRHWSMFADPGLCVYYWRGFVDTVSCTLAEFMAYAQEIAMTHPVRKWVLTDSTPFFGVSNLYSWWPLQQGEVPSRESIPVGLYKHLASIDGDIHAHACHYYITEAAALADLQQACYHYAREKLLASIKELTP